MIMRRRQHKPEVGELELSTFLNVLVVLMSFLLLSAVFSRIAIQELNLPTAASSSAPAQPLASIEVIVRGTGLQVSDSGRVVAAIPKAGAQYDLASLSRHLQQLKSQYSEKKDAMLLVEPDVAYDDVIRVIDTVKVARVERTGSDGRAVVQTVSLFPEVSIGDPP